MRTKKKLKSFTELRKILNHECCAGIYTLKNKVLIVGNKHNPKDPNAKKRRLVQKRKQEKRCTRCGRKINIRKYVTCSKCRKKHREWSKNK